MVGTPRYQPSQASPERKLWGAVLWTAVEDICGITGVGKPATDGQVRSAERYFRTRAFEHLCDLAGFDPDAFRERLVPVLAMPVEDRKRWFKKASKKREHAGDRH